ncbi:MAG: hypothetical protein BGO98_20030 [Myxococcales bacterium 68-20]|nr:MAG: hypothetical protein BGO98_20030 [Myxococcales bacterium 68-20]
MVDGVQNHAVDPFGIVGQVLDAQFRVDRLVGEGGFSAVYRGHHVGLDEPIAVKCLKLPPAISPPLVDQFARRFRDESRILYRLSQGNLNVVRSIAAGTWQAPTGLVVPYMVLEWMEGRSLANEFAIRRSAGKQGRSLEEIVQLFESAADGLGHAHAQGVVHRDLNPGNLFLASSSQGTRMKVLDFGVAKILDESTLDIARMQTVGQIRIFAPAYGAPEQFDDSIGKVGAASDVYSFALILLEALRDRCVNEGQNLGEFALKAIDPNVRPTPRMLGIGVPDEVEQIFARATKLDPRERWQNAGELWRALALAVNSASRQKHAQAAMETPPLAMPQPQGIRSTQKGMAPPPEPAKAPAVRMNKTMPLGAAMPKLDIPRPGAAAPSSTGQSAPKIPAAPSAPTSAPRVPTQPSAGQAATGGPPGQPATQRFTGEGVPNLAEEEDEDARTHVGAMSGKAPLGQGQPQEQQQEEEQEDEVTRVRAPEPDMLRGLADLEAQKLPGKARLATTQLSSGSSPRPAAGAPAVGAPPLQDPASAAGGTFMMAPGPFGEAAPMPSTQPPPPAAAPHAQPEPYRPSSGQLGQTLPLTGPHPLGLPGQASTNGPIPAAGAPPAPYGSLSPDGPSTFGDAGQHGWSPSNPGPQPSQQQQQQQQQFQQPHAPYPAYAVVAPPHAPQQQHPMMQPSPHIMVPSHGQNMPFGQQPHDSRMSESVSLPPGSISGVPKKSNSVLFIAIGLGALALIGVGLAAAVMPGGKGNGTGPVASVSAPPDSSPIASAPPPPPPTAPPVIDPTPAADVVPDASDAVTANSDDDVDAGSTATTTTAAPDVPPAPTPAPTPVPVPVPMPTPVAVKDAGPPPDPNAFNEAAARSRLAQANGVLVFCKKEGGVTGPGTSQVTFGPEGTVTAVSLDPPYAGTPAGDCVTGHFKRTKVSSFQGSPRTIKHSFDVPK